MTSEEIQAIFFVECDESLAAAETGLAACRAGTQDRETINSIFRAVHSVKGGAGAFGFTAMQHFTHLFETLLSDVRDELIAVEPALVDLLLRALDVLSDHVAAARDGGTPPDDSQLLQELAAVQAGPATPAACVDEMPASPDTCAATDDNEDAGPDFDLDALLDDIAGELAPPAPADWTLHVKPLAGAMRNGCEPILMLRELERLGAKVTECNFDAVPALDAFDCEATYLIWSFAVPGSVSEDEVRDIFDFVGDDCELAFGDDGLEPFPKVQAKATVSTAVDPPSPELVPLPAPEIAEAAAAPVRAAQTVRIDLAKLDRLIDSVGELVIAQAMMAQRLSGHGIGAIEELALLEGLTRDIQESAMAIRAQPISSVFSRVPRILRELEASTGKRVNLVVSGEATELDKTVVERLSEPLTHLIRNAVDHGIEDAADRLAAGKDATGTLSLSAEQKSGRILIRIADDGRGIDRARVLAKAVEKGLVSGDAQLADEEIDNLIFAPGFSTAQTVSSISGRGVGMDVVRQNVKELGGRITIESRPGEGTTFVLALPLTLAISDGMIVAVGDQTLVVPLAHVVESLRPSPEDISSLGPDRQMLNVRGKFIPLIPLHAAVGGQGSASDPTKGVLIVVDTEVAGKAALFVDAIHDQRQFVIKSLDAHYRSVTGVAGATILGDGRVALIVDVDGLVADAISTSKLKEAA